MDEHVMQMLENPLPVFVGRYSTTEVLKSSAGITTYRAVDLDAGRRVIVKAASTSMVPEGTELLLRHEASVLQHIASPHVAPLLDVGLDDGTLFLVVPFVEALHSTGASPRDHWTSTTPSPSPRGCWRAWPRSSSTGSSTAT